MGWWSGLARTKRVGAAWYRENGRIGTCVRWDGVVAARIKGRHGTYVVFGSPRALDCTCRARHMPCAHVAAVGAEYEERPERFDELRSSLESLPAAHAFGESVERLLLTNPAPLLEAVERGELGSLPALLAQQHGSVA